MRHSRQIPPDGGYGWVIVFSSALSSFIVLSLVQCSGLIFKDIFGDLSFSATQTSLIVNLNGSFGKLLGPATGVLLKLHGTRRMGLLASALVVAGLVWTSFSYSFVSYLAAYGVISSMGMQMSESTQRLALNLYFKEKRSVAMGFAVTAAGFGPIVVPQLIRFLMKVFNPHQVTLIYGGFCSHIFIAAMLLQPVEWHTKNAVNQCEDGILLEVSKETDTKDTVWSTVSRILDLDLLKDPIFDNILVGLALATFAELNFTLLIPFILNDFGLNTDQIAVFLSTLGAADLLFRFVGPYIGNHFTKPSRLMYAYALVILAGIRFIFLLCENYYALLVIAFLLGIAKGVRKVYMWLVIPDYVPVEKLPSAGGIETLANGICILAGGSLLGFVRDATGSYTACIIVMNCVTVFTIVLWSVEALIVKYKNRRIK